MCSKYCQHFYHLPRLFGVVCLRTLLTKVYDSCSERPPFMRRCNLFDVHFRSSVSQDSFSFQSICIYNRESLCGLHFLLPLCYTLYMFCYVFMMEEE